MRPKSSRAREVERVVLSQGFAFVVQTGSHRKYQHPNGRITIIPFHPGDIKPGTLRQIIANIGSTVEEFNSLV